MENAKVQKGKVIKTIPVEYKKDYINAGWGEVTSSINKSATAPYKQYETNKN